MKIFILSLSPSDMNNFSKTFAVARGVGGVGAWWGFGGRAKLTPTHPILAQTRMMQIEDFLNFLTGLFQWDTFLSCYCFTIHVLILGEAIAP